MLSWDSFFRINWGFFLAEREYRCLGSWEEPGGVTFTYTQRREMDGFQCFVSRIRLFITISSLLKDVASINWLWNRLPHISLIFVPYRSFLTVLCILMILSVVTENWNFFSSPQSGKVLQSGKEAYIKEAGHSCIRGEDPLIYGMKITKHGKLKWKDKTPWYLIISKNHT